MSGLKTLLRPFVLGVLLPLGGCYVAPGAFSPLGVAEPGGTVYGAPPREGFTLYPPGTYGSSQGPAYAGTTCSAGAYVCPVAPGPVGAQCSCPGLGAPSFGTIR